MKPPKDTFNQYKSQFKKMLVCRYNWSVAKAYRFKHDKLMKHYQDGLCTYEAYWNIFNVEPDDYDRQSL